MKKILYSTTAFILCGIAQSQAACIATPSCTTLGYTETSSCDGGLKCPFGSYWYCPSNSGSGGASSTCKIGSILFSDKTCGDDVQYGKTPIGVVVYLGGSGGQALALESIDFNNWGGSGIDIPGLTNRSLEEARQDYASCENSKKIMAAGDKSKYPAVWAANEYSTEGTKAGDWCLPAAGIGKIYRDNYVKLEAVYSSILNKDTLSSFWTSTENTSTRTFYASSSSNVTYVEKGARWAVVPVLEF